MRLSSPNRAFHLPLTVLSRSVFFAHVKARAQRQHVVVVLAKRQRAHIGQGTHLHPSPPTTALSRADREHTRGENQPVLCFSGSDRNRKPYPARPRSGEVEVGRGMPSRYRRGEPAMRVPSESSGGGGRSLWGAAAALMLALAAMCLPAASHAQDIAEIKTSFSDGNGKVAATNPASSAGSLASPPSRVSARRRPSFPLYATAGRGGTRGVVELTWTPPLTRRVFPGGDGDGGTKTARGGGALSVLSRFRRLRGNRTLLCNRFFLFYYLQHRVAHNCCTAIIETYSRPE